MDYCKICKKKTKCNGEQNLLKTEDWQGQSRGKTEDWGRYQLAELVNQRKNNISKSVEDIETEYRHNT